MLVTVGTDHHRFDRLSDWVEAWLADHPAVHCTYQHGTSRPIARATCEPMMPRTALQTLLATSDVVVAQGGPGSISDARQAGVRPLVVPRRADLREAIDDHQVHFCRRLAVTESIFVAEDEFAFRGVLSSLTSDPARSRIEPGDSAIDETAARVSAVLDDIVGQRSGGLSLRRVAQLVSRRRRTGVSGAGH